MMPLGLISPEDIRIPPNSPSCETCEKGGAESRCSRCRSVLYCNASCQRADWQGHRTNCVSYATLFASNSQMFEVWTSIWGDSIMHWAAFSADPMLRGTDFLARFVLELELAQDVQKRTPASAYEVYRARWVTKPELTVIIADRRGEDGNIQISPELLLDAAAASTLRILILSGCEEMYYCCSLPGVLQSYMKLVTLPGYEFHSAVLARCFRADFFNVVLSGDGVCPRRFHPSSPLITIDFSSCLSPPLSRGYTRATGWLTLFTVKCGL